MNKVEFHRTLKKLLRVMELTEEMDLNGFLEAIRHAKTVGPVTDPEVFKAAKRKLEVVENMAYGLNRFKLTIPLADEQRRIIKDEVNFQIRG